MRTQRAWILGLSAILVGVLAACGGGSNGSSGGGGDPRGSLQSVNHVIVMVQENRSFDNYFGALNDYRSSQGLSRDVDGTPSNAANIGYDGTTMIQAFHLATECTEDLSSFWNESHVDWNPRGTT